MYEIKTKENRFILIHPVLNQCLNMQKDLNPDPSVGEETLRDHPVKSEAGGIWEKKNIFKNCKYNIVAVFFLLNLSCGGQLIH